MNSRLVIDYNSYRWSDEHPSSSYGIPVLVWDRTNEAMGPDDTCRLLVQDATDETIEGLRRFGYSVDDVRSDYPEYRYISPAYRGSTEAYLFACEIDSALTDEEKRDCTSQGSYLWDSSIPARAEFAREVDQLVKHIRSL